jgi:hypothetical protein
MQICFKPANGTTSFMPIYQEIMWVAKDNGRILELLLIMLKQCFTIFG